MWKSWHNTGPHDSTVGICKNIDATKCGSEIWSECTADLAMVKKKHSTCGFSHLVLPSFWQSEGRENLLVEYAMWTHLDTSPSSHRSACFDPAAATVQQKLSFDVGNFRCSQGVCNMTWVGCWHFFCEDESEGFRLSLGLFWGWLPCTIFFLQIFKGRTPCFATLCTATPYQQVVLGCVCWGFGALNIPDSLVNLVGHLQATKIVGQVTPSTSRK